MSPHQRGLILAASAVKSRRIRSARAAAAGSGDGGLVLPLRRPALQAAAAHQPGDPLAGMRAAAAAQLRMDPRGAVAALGLLVHGLDLGGQLGVVPVALRRCRSGAA